MNKIIMLYGAPMSGKSVAAKKLVAHFAEESVECEVVKTVSTRYHGKKVKLTVESIDETIEKTRIEKDESYRAQIELARTALEHGKLPILDATYHKFYRREWAYEMAEQTNSELVVLWLVFGNESELRKSIKERSENPDYKDNVLDCWDKYMTMISQTDKIEEFELARNMPVNIVRYNREKGIFRFYCFKSEFVEEIVRAMK